jgi:uncharacterized membrane protein YoaK (UPF0700 family)
MGAQPSLTSQRSRRHHCSTMLPFTMCLLGLFFLSLLLLLQPSDGFSPNAARPNSWRHIASPFSSLIPPPVSPSLSSSFSDSPIASDTSSPKVPSSPATSLSPIVSSWPLEEVDPTDVEQHNSSVSKTKAVDNDSIDVMMHTHEGDGNTTTNDVHIVHNQRINNNATRGSSTLKKQADATTTTVKTSRPLARASPPMILAKPSLFSASSTTLKPALQRSQSHTPPQQQQQSQQPAVATPIQPSPSTKTASHEQRTHVFACALAAYAGIVDVLCLNKHSCYVNMITGNSIKCLMALVDARWRDSLQNGILVFTYGLGAMWYRVLTKGGTVQPFPVPATSSTTTTSSVTISQPSSRTGPLSFLHDASWPYGRQVILSASALWMLGDIMAYMTQIPTWQASMLIMGFGVINTATLDLTGVINYAMTGHLNRVGFGATDQLTHWFRSPSKTSATPTAALQTSRTHMRKASQVLMSFLTGVLVTAGGHAWSQSHSAIQRGTFMPMGTLFSGMYACLFHGYYRSSVGLSTWPQFVVLPVWMRPWRRRTRKWIMLNKANTLMQ